MPRRTLAQVLCLLLFLTGALAAPAPAADPPGPLADTRWQEHAYGVSLSPPRDAAVVQAPRDGALVAFHKPDHYTIKVYLRQADQPVDLEWIRNQTSLEVSYGSRQALLVDEQETRLGGRPGLISYYIVESTRPRPRNLQNENGGDNGGGEGGKWVFGQAVMKIDPRTQAVIHLECPSDRFDASRELFEAVLGSIDMLSPTELDRVRSAWVRAGARWAKGVDRRALKAAMVPEQWFRIVEGQKDVGYMRLRNAVAEESGLPGVRIDVDSRIVVEGDSYDTRSFFFESDDGDAEIWSVRTGRRSLAGADAPGLAANGAGGSGGAGALEGPAQVSEETGLRSGERISVTRAAPGRVDEPTWVMPPEGYLSQVESRLVGRLFPRDRQQDFAFYIYDSQDGDLKLRTVQVYPTEAGGYMVRERHESDAREQISYYDATGRLLERQRFDGRLLVPATVEEIRALWGDAG